MSDLAMVSNMNSRISETGALIAFTNDYMPWMQEVGMA